jgi:hypothetical protein
MRLFAAFLLTVSCASSQTFNWLRYFPGDRVLVNGIASSLDGRIYIAGGDENTCLMALGPDGQVQWTRLGCNAFNPATAVHVDRANELFIGDWASRSELSKNDLAGNVIWRSRYATPIGYHGDQIIALAFGWIRQYLCCRGRLAV